MIKRIVIIILMILLTVTVFLFSYVLFNNINVERDIIKLKEKKELVVSGREKLSEETNKLNNELSNLKETLKDQVAEYELWKETKEKLKNIIG